MGSIEKDCIFFIPSNSHLFTCSRYGHETDTNPSNRQMFICADDIPMGIPLRPYMEVRLGDVGTGTSLIIIEVAPDCIRFEVEGEEPRTKTMRNYFEIGRKSKNLLEDD